MSTTLTVYFEGTANALKVRRDRGQSYEDGGHYKIAFDGCGVTNGMMGTLFATGLHAQCKVVEAHIKAMLSLSSSSLLSSKTPKAEMNNEVVVNLNVVGLSRGGIAAIQLAQMLHYIAPQRLHINLLLFDPVPGNLIGSSRYFDIFRTNTANSALDMTYCQNLCDVLALYPYEPLPDIAFHAPVLPRYPPQCTVEEDATLGCHQGALFCASRSIESRLSYFRIREWLEKHGTKLYTSTYGNNQNGSPADVARASAVAQGEKLSMNLNEYKALLDQVMFTPPSRHIPRIVRHAHSSPPGAVIVMHGAPDTSSTNSAHTHNNDLGFGKRYLNHHHREITERLSASTFTPATNNTDQMMDTDKGKAPRIELLLQICRPEPVQQSFFSFNSCVI